MRETSRCCKYQGTFNNANYNSGKAPSSWFLPWENKRRVSASLGIPN
jgi:hypothetical protein